MHQDRVDNGHGVLGLLHPPQRHHQRIHELAEVVLTLLVLSCRYEYVKSSAKNDRCITFNSAAIRLSPGARQLYTAHRCWFCGNHAIDSDRYRLRDRDLVVERSIYWDIREAPAPLECKGGHSANGLDP